MEANLRRITTATAPIHPRYSHSSSSISSTIPSGGGHHQPPTGTTAQTDNNNPIYGSQQIGQGLPPLFANNNSDDDYESYLHYTPLDDTEEWILFSAAESSSNGNQTYYADSTSNNSDALYDRQQPPSTQLAFPNHDGVGSFMDHSKTTTAADEPVESSSSSPDKAARINAWRLEQSHVVYNEITSSSRASTSSHLDGDEEAAAASLETLLTNPRGGAVNESGDSAASTGQRIFSLIADNFFKRFICLDDEVLDIVFGAKQVDETCYPTKSSEQSTTTMTPPMLVRYLCTHFVSMMQAENRNPSSSRMDTASRTTATTSRSASSSLRPIHAHPFIRHPPPPVSRQQSNSYYSSLYPARAAAAAGPGSLCSWQSLRSGSSRYHHHYWETSSSATGTESSFTNQIQLGF